jgi:phosphotransferase system HPr-like phosphotransfer protein
MEKTFVLNDPLGFHARPAAVVVGIFASALLKAVIKVRFSFSFLLNQTASLKVIDFD